MRRNKELEKMLEKYNAQINNPKSLSNKKEKEKPIKLDNFKKTTISLNSEDIVEHFEPRNKKLEEMLKKLNTERNIYEYNNLNTSKISGHHSFNGKSNNINSSFISERNIKQNKNNSEIIDNDDNKGILSLLRKSRKNNNNKKKGEELFKKTTDSVSSFPFNPIITINSPLNSNRYNNNDLLLSTTDTNKIVQSIDEKIKTLKFKFLHDTHIDIFKLSKYQKSLVKLYSFLEPMDIYGIYHSIRFSRDNLRNFLTDNCKKYIINPFRDKFKEQFYLESTKIIFKCVDNRNFNILLVIKAQLLLDSYYKDKTIEIENNLSTIQMRKKEQLIRNVYRFDYKYKSTKNQIWWILKENTYFNYDQNKNNSYSMPIIPFKLNDYFEISVNVLSPMGFIHFENFIWKPIKILSNQTLNYIDYENYKIKKVKDKQLCDFDLSRFCEMELIKTKWNDESRLKDKNISDKIKEFINHFNENFNVNKIEFDDVGFYIIKMYFTAKKSGFINKNNIGININILEKNEKICNEIRKNGLIIDIGKGVEIQIGDILVFYLTLNNLKNENEK